MADTTLSVSIQVWRSGVARQAVDKTVGIRMLSGLSQSWVRICRNRIRVLEMVDRENRVCRGDVIWTRVQKLLSLGKAGTGAAIRNANMKR
jgi:hypothetical protein